MVSSSQVFIIEINFNILNRYLKQTTSKEGQLKKYKFSINEIEEKQIKIIK